jgi:hypothetical protein
MIYNRRGEDLCIKGEHPFIKITPLPIYNYIWGQSLVQNLMGLQDWRDQHNTRIDTIFRRKMRPSRTFTGPWVGLTDEKMAALDREGGFFHSVQPTAKVDSYAPEVDISQAMAYLSMLDDYFYEMAGLPNILRGKGEVGIRAGGHAEIMQQIGSSRIKKMALVLEDSCEKLATLMFKMQRVHDEEVYLDEEQKEFLLAQIDDRFQVKVSGHSLSPVFVEDTKAQADKMLAMKEIDRRSHLQLTQPPMAEMLEERLKKIEEGESKAAQTEMGLKLLKAAPKK